MTEQDKQLLLKDLCARLPYGVKFLWRYLDINDEGQDEEVNVIADVKNIGTDGMIECGYKEIEDSDFCYISEIKPYLRPLSSMTDKEETEFEETLQYTQYTLESYDYLNSHHFDYRGLIEKDLALEAPEEMYSTK